MLQATKTDWTKLQLVLKFYALCTGRLKKIYGDDFDPDQEFQESMADIYEKQGEEAQLNELKRRIQIAQNADENDIPRSWLPF